MKTVELIGYGIGYHLPDGTIQLNRALLEDKRIYDEVLAHERAHTDGGYHLTDLVTEFKQPSIRQQLFCLTHPSTWIALMPFRLHKGEFRYDPSEIIKYLIFIGLIYSVKVTVW